MMPDEIIFANARQLVTCAGPPRARRGIEMQDVGVLHDVALAVRDGLVSEIGPHGRVHASHPDARVLDCSGLIITPGLVDSHTHALFGGHRARELEMRAGGMEYLQIAAMGGGIHASVNDLRARTDAELATLLKRRLLHMCTYGTTTVEVKSGYGLDTHHELRSLQVIRSVADTLAMRVIPTWLGAHEFPHGSLDRPGGREDYLRSLIREMLPAVAAARLAHFADVFCEPGVFTPEEARSILTASAAAGLGLKIHADELQWSGGAELAASLTATSADHLAQISDAGIRALASAGVVATLLPGTMLFLGKPSRAPARRMLDAGCALALATDFNPGTSPTVNLPLMMTLATTQLGLTPAEALVAATTNGAAALGIPHQTGQLSPGFHADIAVWEVEHFHELPYWYGDRLCRGSWSRGKACYQFNLPITS